MSVPIFNEYGSRIVLLLRKNVDYCRFTLAD